MALRIIRKDTNIPFISFSRAAIVVSAVVILLGLGSLLIKGGPRLGIDFAGGITVQLKFGQEVEIDRLKGALGETGIEGLQVQRFGLAQDNEYLVRIAATDVSTEDARSLISDALEEGMPATGWAIQRSEMVGPKVGADLRSKAMEAMFYAVLLIAIYISGRFERRWWAAGAMAAGLAGGVYLLGLTGLSMSYLIWAALAITLLLCWRLKLNYALGAVVALMHDVIITVGVFSLLNKEFDLSIVAALLTIIGYSLNDTIIVFDRIRENLRARLSKSFHTTINVSINQTLSRTILTSGTTLIVVLSLFLFGGGVIHDFSFALLVGVIVGTYSSIFVASPILLGFKPRPEKEETAEA
jgi:preprotein translocase subunit SecF